MLKSKALTDWSVGQIDKHWKIRTTWKIGPIKGKAHPESMDTAKEENILFNSTSHGLIGLE